MVEEEGSADSVAPAGEVSGCAGPVAEVLGCGGEA